MSLWQVVRTRDGKKEVVMTDSLAKCRGRIKELRGSSRGKKVGFALVPSTATEKFKAKPVGGHQHQ